MIIITQKPSFRRIYKKLIQTEKSIVDKAINHVLKTPMEHESKKGDLSGLFVYKFKINKQEKLLAYTCSIKELTLINLGSHENFYRNLKRVQ